MFYCVTDNTSWNKLNVTSRHLFIKPVAARPFPLALLLALPPLLPRRQIEPPRVRLDRRPIQGVFVLQRYGCILQKVKKNYCCTRLVYVYEIPGLDCADVQHTD